MVFSNAEIFYGYLKMQYCQTALTVLTLLDTTPRIVMGLRYQLWGQWLKNRFLVSNGGQV